MSRLVGPPKPLVEGCVLLLCDVQESSRKAIHGFDSVVEVARRMVSAAGVLGVPTFVTEQRPDKLGSTVSEIDLSRVPSGRRVAKERFSMMVGELRRCLEALPERKTALLCGLEAHICIDQTALDLLRAGYDVHIIVDAVSSRTLQDRSVALERLRSYGCRLATSEQLLFALMEASTHPSFREVQKLIMPIVPAVDSL